MKIMISGASGGIGHFLSKEYDKDENELFLTYNTSKDKVYKPTKAKFTIIHCDFTKDDDAMNAFSKIESLDVLINVMGNVENELIYRMDEGQWDRVITSNLKTVFLSCKYGFSKMAENGHVINITSVLGSMGMIGATNYVAAKGGVEAFTKSFALECLHNRRIFVNAIALGYFNIGMGINLSEKVVEIITKRILLKEFGKPEEIVKVIDYIISSRYLVGQVIHLNGGLRI